MDALKRLKVLLIEDETDQILVVQMRLEASGFEVMSATDADAGWKLAYGERPALILLDLILGDVNGLELCRQLKETPETKQIPLIIFTGSTAKDLEKACRDAGADGCLRKPYSSEELVASVKALIGQPKGMES